MRKFRPILVISVFILFFFLPLKAQQPPDYLFLEILDSQGSPVADATVESKGYHEANNKNEFSRVQKTYEDGKAQFALPWRIRDFTNSVFRVSKPGYYAYQDLGFITSYPYYGMRATLELLKIPENEIERRALGNEQMKREFMWAAKTGDAATVRRLLKAGAGANLNTNDLRGIPGPKNVPAVLLAAASGDRATIEALLRAGAVFRVTKEPGQSVLMHYLRADPFRYKKAESEKERAKILKDYEKGAEFLIKVGADFEGDPKERLAALMTAANRGYRRILQKLLALGFSVNSKDKDGQSVLMRAAENFYEKRESKAETVRFLLKAGADPNLRDAGGCMTALGWAAMSGDLETIKALIEGGAQIKADCPGYSILIRAVNSRNPEAAKFLIEAGADINATGADGKNILMMAAENNDLEMVKMLIEKGLPVNARNRQGATALMHISDYPPALEIAKTLLRAGADPNLFVEDKKSGYCYTPLMRFANPYHLQYLKLLIENGADVNLACGNGKTVLFEAIKRYRPEVVKQLIESGANAEGEQVDQALTEIKTYFKEDSYERKYVDETVRLIEEARAKKKS